MICPYCKLGFTVEEVFMEGRGLGYLVSEALDSTKKHMIIELDAYVE
jgi:hypothetical protein